MKPTISNAFHEDDSVNPKPEAEPPSAPENVCEDECVVNAETQLNPRRSLAGSLAPMQVDLCATEFGCVLELTPIQAADAIQALNPDGREQTSATYLLAMQQDTWLDGEMEVPIATIAERLSIPVIERLGADQLVVDERSLRQFVSLCHPTRLLVVAVEGPIEARDAAAIEKAIINGKSPLDVELRATLALEVLGDRAVVLHTRDQAVALEMVAQNFRHYLAALSNRPISQFSAPQPWQIERLLGVSGAITVRPIETQRYSTSIDIGINTSRERFTHPADQSLIYDVPSNTWHDEP